MSHCDSIRQSFATTTKVNGHTLVNMNYDFVLSIDMYCTTLSDSTWIGPYPYLYKAIINIERYRHIEVTSAERHCNLEFLSL